MTTAQRSQFSQRIGDTIRQSDRDYFGLFTGITDYSSAAIHPDGDSTTIVIHRLHHQDTTVVLPYKTAQELSMYIDESESIYRGERQVDWSSLHGLVSPAQPFFEGNSISVQDRSGQEHSGMLYYAGEDIIAVGPSISHYDWRSLDTLIVLRSTDISWIRQGNNALIGTSSGLIAHALIGYFARDLWNEVDDEDLRIAGSLLTFGASAVIPYLGFLAGSALDIDKTIISGTEYLEILPQLRRQAYFHSFPPPEIVRQPPRIVLPAPADTLPRLFRVEESPFTITGAVGGGYVAGGEILLNTIGRFSNTRSENGVIAFSLATSYRLSSSISVGVTFQKSIAIRPSDNTEYLAHFSAIMAPAFSLMTQSLGSTIDFHFAPGVGYTFFEASSQLTSPFPDADVHTETPVTASGVTVAARTGFTYHIQRNLALSILLDQSVTGPVTFPRYSLISSIGPIVAVPEHTLQPMVTSISVGIQMIL
jgi:hypothetical protein